MELKVNGKSADITLEGEKTVGEVLKAFEAEAAKANATTVSIVLNGTPVAAKDFDEAIKTPITDSTLIELNVISKMDIADSFALSCSEFTKLAKELQNVPVLLQSGRDKEANVVITKLASEIDRFCHAATLSALFPDTYSKLLIDGKEIGTFFAEFAPVLSDFENALQSKDTVTVGDLAEYEISPRLEKLAAAIKEINS
jgi:UPF0288 family protein (methanogenesis marker protein 3)